MISQHRISRRAFVVGNSLVLCGGAGRSFSSECFRAESSGDQPIRAALLTDLHYADKPAAGSRHYRDTLEKLAIAADQLKQSSITHPLDFVIELGDLIDAADSVETEMKYLARVNRDFAAIADNRHYVLGNHCVTTLTKPEFLGAVEREKSFYSFDVRQFHFVVLDACFRSDGVAYGRQNFVWTDANIPQDQLDWLAEDLKSTDKPTIVFVHQRMDTNDHHGIKNAAAVRAVLECSGHVFGVFQGHSHKNDHREINDIHYCTLAAMIEGPAKKDTGKKVSEEATPSTGTDVNNAFSRLTIEVDGTIRLEGFFNQSDYRWAVSPQIAPARNG